MDCPQQHHHHPLLVGWASKPQETPPTLARGLLIADSRTVGHFALLNPLRRPPPQVSAPPPNSPPLHSSRHNAEVPLFCRAPERPGRSWQGRAEAADPRYRHYKNREADNPHPRRRKVRIKPPPPLEREANPGGRSSVGGESRWANCGGDTAKGYQDTP